MELHERPADEQVLIMMIKSRLTMITRNADKANLQTTLHAIARLYVEVESILQRAEELSSGEETPS